MKTNITNTKVMAKRTAAVLPHYLFTFLPFFLFTILAVGCSDFLEQTSPSENNQETTYNSEYYTSLRVNKIYGGLTYDETYSQYMNIVWALNSDVELVDGLGSDAANTGSERGNMNYNASPGWNRLSRLWDRAYGVIEDANDVVEGIENSSLLSGSSATAMRRYEGEALTLRAMLYLDMIRFFGDIPMKLETSKSDLSNAYLTKTDRDVILDTIMSDLDRAIEYLPWAGQNGYTTEHATKGYAHALLAQIALTRAGYAIREQAKDGYETASYSDAVYPTQRPDASTRRALYERALTHLSAIIKSGVHSLNPSFRNEWYLLNQRQLDTRYRENLFEIPMGLNTGSELGYTVGVRMNGVTSRFGYGNSSGKMKLTAPFFYSFDRNDLRRDVTCSNIQYKEGTNAQGATATVCEMLGDTPFGIYVGKWDPRMEAGMYNDAGTEYDPSKAGSGDWLDENQKTSQKHLTGINCVKMRYSQVLLLYAEVMNELAGPDGNYSGDAGLTARQALAMVHARAFDDAHKSQAEAYVAAIAADKDAMFNAIVDENAWELAGEGIRKFDLIRWNLLTEKTLEMKQKYLEEVQEAETLGDASTGFQKTVYFNYTDATRTDIDESSITWWGLPAGATTADYDSHASSFGSSKASNASDKNVYTNLPSISSGLVGSALNPSQTPDVTVKNRYLLPIASTTISASNGHLHNSYGYQD